MTRKSSYEVFLLTFWRMKTSYDDFSVLQNIRKLRHFSRLTRFFLFIKTSSRAKDVCGICSGES